MLQSLFVIATLLADGSDKTDTVNASKDHRSEAVVESEAMEDDDDLNLLSAEDIAKLSHSTITAKESEGLTHVLMKS